MSLAVATIPVAVASVYAARKNSLSRSGIAAAWLVGPMAGLASHKMAVHLYAFFLSSSRITRVGEALKARIDGEFKRGGLRDWRQVLCNGGLQTLIAGLHLWISSLAGLGRSPDHPNSSVSRWRAVLNAAHLAAYACAAGDTWASEIGVLSRSAPRLITAPWRVVPPGTNGGVSMLGLAASAAGGASIGLAQCVYELIFRGSHEVGWAAIGQAALAGFVGSAVDSVLGATLQYSGAVPTADPGVVRIVNAPTPAATRISGRALLTNNQVNVAAIVCAAIFGALTEGYFYGPRKLKQSDIDGQQARETDSR